MAYTPINWDEVTPITPTNLNKMDGQIDTNEDDLRTIQGGEVSVDGRITNLENGTTGTNATTYKGNDIDTDGDGKVNSAVNADSADAIGGFEFTLVATGSVTGTSSEIINLLSGEQHNYYIFSAYSDSTNVLRYDDDLTDFASIIQRDTDNDLLRLGNLSASNTYFYSVYALV